MYEATIHGHFSYQLYLFLLHDRWIQHFDGTKGCHICIVDMPPVQTSEVALWRRLLLGEGELFDFCMIIVSILLYFQPRTLNTSQFYFVFAMSLCEL